MTKIEEKKLRYYYKYFKIIIRKTYLSLSFLRSIDDSLVFDLFADVGLLFEIAVEDDDVDLLLDLFS